MRIQSFLMVSLIVLPFTLTSADTSGNKTRQPLNIKDETVRINYSLGYQIGGDFKRQGVMMNAEAVIQGIEDALKGGQPQMSRPEMYTVLRDLKSRIVSQERGLKREMQLQKLAEDKKFLEKNKSKPGVKITASGLQYMIIREGKGKRPKATDQVTVNYRGSLINKQEFDSSYSRGKPATFALNGVIKGWTEGLQLIKEGGKIKLFIPEQLAYNDRGPLAHRTLIFDVELLAVNNASQKK